MKYRYLLFLNIFIGTASASFGSESVSLYSRIQNIFRSHNTQRMPGAPLEWPRLAYPSLDISRRVLGVDKIQKSEQNEIIPFTGKGVTIAVIDGGIDPRHIAFSQAGEQELSRVVRYIFTESMAESESGELEMKEYSDVLNLSYDDIDTGCGGHGTHVAGIAAGADCGTPYVGIAPDANLFLVSMGDLLYDDEIAFGMKSALDYAQKELTPLVLNFSLGSATGSKRGDNPVTEILAEYPEAGNIAMFAAGNDGQNAICLDRDFSLDPTPLATVFSRVNTGTAAQSLFMDAYSLDEREFEIAIAVVNLKDQYSEIWRSEFIPYSEFNDDGLCFILHGDTALFPELKKFFNGSIIAGREITAAGDYHLILQASLEGVDTSTPFTPAVIVRSNEGAHVSLTSDIQSATFRSYGLPGYSSGDSRLSISDYCTSHRVISVGAWNARDAWSGLDGDTHELSATSWGVTNGVGCYSSYGYVRGDEDNTLPSVLAPGTFVISSITPGNKAYKRAYALTSGSTEYFWGSESGTSMASPAAAGVVALWLQACPTLTRDQILDVMRATSKQDEAIIGTYNAGECGKLDAYEGLKYILSTMGAETIPADKAPSGLMIKCYGEGDMEFVLPFQCSGGNAYIYAADGRTVTHMKFKGNTFSRNLPAGIYLAKVETDAGVAVQRFVCR